VSDIFKHATKLSNWQL